MNYDVLHNISVNFSSKTRVWFWEIFHVLVFLSCDLRGLQRRKAMDRPVQPGREGGSQMYLRDRTTLLRTQDERIGVLQPTVFRRRVCSGKDLIVVFQYLKRLIRKTETLFPLPPPLSKFYCWAELMWYGISLWSVWVGCPSCVPLPRAQPTGEGGILERHPGCSRAQHSRSQSTGTLSTPF